MNMNNLIRRASRNCVYYRLDIDNLEHNVMPESWRKTIMLMRDWNIATSKLLFTSNPLETRMADAYWEEETGFGCVKWQDWLPPKEIIT